MQRRDPPGTKCGWPILLLSLGLLFGMTACDSGPDWGMPASAKDVPNPVPPTAQNLAAAGAIYVGSLRALSRRTWRWRRPRRQPVQAFAGELDR